VDGFGDASDESEWMDAFSDMDGWWTPLFSDDLSSFLLLPCMEYNLPGPTLAPIIPLAQSGWLLFVSNTNLHTHIFVAQYFSNMGIDQTFRVKVESSLNTPLSIR
jgi:hypothetical protein